MIGKAFRGCARAFGNEFKEGRFGSYDGWSDGDLPVVEFYSAGEWFKNNFNFHSLGRERGEKMGKLRTQDQGGAYAPYTEAGCNALAQRYKEDIAIDNVNTQENPVQTSQCHRPPGRQNVCVHTQTLCFPGIPLPL